MKRYITFHAVDTRHKVTGIGRADRDYTAHGLQGNLSYSVYNKMDKVEGLPNCMCNMSSAFENRTIEEEDMAPVGESRLMG